MPTQISELNFQTCTGGQSKLISFRTCEATYSIILLSVMLYVFMIGNRMRDRGG